MDIQPLFAVDPPPVSRSPIRWPGGKWYFRNQIVPRLGRHVKEVVSPFLGGAHIELELAARGIRVFGSDIYLPLVKLWKQLLTRPGEFAEELRDALGGYPVDREKATRAMRWWHDLTPSSTDEEVARAMLATCKMGYGAMIGRHRPHPYLRDRGGECEEEVYAFTEGYHKRLCRFHAPLLTVEHMDYRHALASLPDTPAYCDPPYRIDSGIYGPRGEVHDAFDHDEFAEVMLRRDSPWAISYNDTEEIREVFAGCEILKVYGKYSIGKTLACQDSQEILIINDWRP